MTRPTPKPIEWRVGYEGLTLTTLSSALLDGRYYLNKTYYTYEERYTYAVRPVDKNDISLTSEPSAAELLKTLYHLQGQYLVRAMPETFAALASITSNEDWENLDA